MSVYTQILTSIQARLEAVANIGQVQIWERYSPKRSDQLDHYQSNVGGRPHLRGWVITLDNNGPIVTTRDTFTSFRRTITFLIFGFMTVQDEVNTEGEFIDLMISALDALEGNIQPDTTPGDTLEVQPISVRLYEMRLMGSALCHYCEMTVPVEVVWESLG